MESVRQNFSLKLKNNLKFHTETEKTQDKQNSSEQLKSQFSSLHRPRLSD